MFLKLRQPFARITHNRNINKYTNMRRENCALLDYYAASSGNSLPTFLDNLTIPSSRVKNNPEERSSSTSRRKPEIALRVACLLFCLVPPVRCDSCLRYLASHDLVITNAELRRTCEIIPIEIFCYYSQTKERIGNRDLQNKNVRYFETF